MLVYLTSSTLLIYAASVTSGPPGRAVRIANLRIANLRKERFPFGSAASTRENARLTLRCDCFNDRSTYEGS